MGKYGFAGESKVVIFLSYRRFSAHVEHKIQADVVTKRQVEDKMPYTTPWTCPCLGVSVYGNGN